MRVDANKEPKHVTDWQAEKFRRIEWVERNKQAMAVYESLKKYGEHDYARLYRRDSDIKNDAWLVCRYMQTYSYIEHPRVGDVVMVDGKSKRIAYRWTGYVDDIPEDWEAVQLDAGVGSYVLGDGHVSMSGSLDLMTKAKLRLTDETSLQHCWLFTGDCRAAHHGITCLAPFRVYEIEESKS